MGSTTIHWNESRFIVYKIVPAPLWRASEESGEVTGSLVDVRDGFIHFSTAEQLRETAARHFAGVDNLLLVAVSADQLTSSGSVREAGPYFPISTRRYQSRRCCGRETCRLSMARM